MFGQLDLAFFGQAGDGINNGVIWVNGPYVALLAEGQPLLLCPSDGYGGTHSPPLAADHVRGLPRNNYYGFYNGLDRRDLSYDYMQVVPRNPPPDRTRLGMFDIIRVTRAAQVRDGLSNTMAITEGLTGGPLEVRGLGANTVDFDLDKREGIPEGRELRPADASHRQGRYDMGREVDRGRSPAE